MTIQVQVTVLYINISICVRENVKVRIRPNYWRIFGIMINQRSVFEGVVSVSDKVNIIAFVFNANGEFLVGIRSEIHLFPGEIVDVSFRRCVKIFGARQAAFVRAHPNVGVLGRQSVQTDAGFEPKLTTPENIKCCGTFIIHCRRVLISIRLDAGVVESVDVQVPQPCAVLHKAVHVDNSVQFSQA